MAEHEHVHSVSTENERRTLIVILFTIIAMCAEIAYGYFTNSMALLADGYHMGTHALALGLTYAAYVLTRKFAGSPLFANGTDKIGTLTAYTSSLFLGLTGIWIIAEAFMRFVNPLEIKFDEAILVAVIGLVVNTVCILIMEFKHNSQEEHHHDEHGAEEHDGHMDAHNKDYNFMAAYYHILADALTSVLAIGALIAGKYFNIVCLDSLIGILGGVLILRWSYGLLKNTVKILVDIK